MLSLQPNRFEGICRIDVLLHSQDLIVTEPLHKRDRKLELGAAAGSDACNSERERGIDISALLSFGGLFGKLHIPLRHVRLSMSQRAAAARFLSNTAGTMSRENVAVVMQSLDAYARRDIQALRAITDADVQLDWSASRGWLAGVYKGIDQALGFYEGYFEAFAEIEFEPHGIIEAGDSVVVPNVARQRGRDGIEVSARSTLVFTVRKRKITRICLYQEKAQALAALGLVE